MVYIHNEPSSREQFSAIARKAAFIGEAVKVANNVTDVEDLVESLAQTVQAVAVKHVTKAAKLGEADVNAVLLKVVSAPEFRKQLEDHAVAIAEKAADAHRERLGLNALSDRMARIQSMVDQVNAQASQRPVRTPDPRAGEYRMKAASMSDRTLRRGYEQLAAEAELNG